MAILSERINKLSESQTIAMARQSRELKAKGLDIISLSLGEPDFNTPDFIKDAAKKAIDENFTKYTPVPGYQDLREAISAKFKRDNNLDYRPDQIVVSTGAKQSIANAVMSLISPGDEVLIPAPYWVSYMEIIKLAEGKPVIISTSVEDDFKVSPEQLEKAITDKTRMMIFSSPCNPSGSVYSKKELKEIANVFREKEIYIISDEIYEYINFTGKHASIAEFDYIHDQVITINGVSKGYAMTGWRIGYLAAPKWIADACTKMQGQITSGACGISQKAAKAALESDPALTQEMCNAFLKRRDLVIDQLSGIKGFKVNKPQGAFYSFPDISYYLGKQAHGTMINNATDFCMYLLHEANVALVTGEAFGAPECIRISYATSESELLKAMERIKIAVEKIS